MDTVHWLAVKVVRQEFRESRNVRSLARDIRLPGLTSMLSRCVDKPLKIAAGTYASSCSKAWPRLMILALAVECQWLADDIRRGVAMSFSAAYNTPRPRIVLTGRHCIGSWRVRLP